MERGPQVGIFKQPSELGFLDFVKWLVADNNPISKELLKLFLIPVFLL